ncbi:MAG: glutathione S-transferase [Planktomarina sp.]|jgi:glutathione S-transferase|tara:strand:+ start:1150 stop:1782 length:633 start_codon:yes stop_codon:yes gene_type:complete
MYKLYYSQGLASIVPHFVLQEIGAEFDLVEIDRSKGEHQTPEYLALNPNGRIPTFKDGDKVLFETAAICLHLADHHPEAKLIPLLGTYERSEVYQWITFLTNSLQVDFWQFYRPEFYVTAEHYADYKTVMAGHVVRHLEVLDVHLKDRDFIVGNQLTIVDFYLLMLGRWSRHITPPTRSFPHITRVLESLCNRTSVIRTFDREGISLPYF